MKVFFNRVPRDEPFGGGNQFLSAMVKHLVNHDHEVTFNLEENIDIIFLMDPRPGDIGYSIEHVSRYKSAHPETKILHRVNECDKRKDTSFIDKILLDSANISDEVVFISQWLADYFVNAGYDKDYHVIYNGCNADHFYPGNRKIVTHKPKLVTHHWSDNWMKGFDLYTEIDRYLQDNDDFEFTYVGRYNKTYSPSATSIVGPLSGASLGNELRKHDIYVTASKFEPCGMHHIEGAASGMPVIYHTDTGGIKELCKQHGEEYETFHQFLNAIDIIVKDYKSYVSKIDTEFMNIDRCVSQYYNIIESMVN